MYHILTDAVQLEMITGNKSNDGLVVLLWLAYGNWYKTDYQKDIQIDLVEEKKKLKDKRKQN